MRSGNRFVFRWVAAGLASFASVACAAAADLTLIAAAHRLAPEAPAWRELTEQLTRRPDLLADFEERRFFPFRKEPVVLKGEVRVSRQHGLSLRYTAPEERTLIFDDKGMLVREPGRRAAPPPDPRASMANEALRHILRLDFAALAPNFELYGRRDATAWSLALVPRAAAMRRAIGNIFVMGEGDSVRSIELHRSEKQHIDIFMGNPRTVGEFSADEAKRFFR